MCDKCERNLEENNDPADLALMALAVLGGLVEAFIEDEYCDPTLYRALGLGAKIADRLGADELADRFRFVQIRGGEVVNKIIEEQGLPIGKDEWS